MNVMFCNFGQGHSAVPKYVKEKLPLDDIHLVVNGPSDLIIDCKNYFFVRDCQLGNFTDPHDYNDIPLDEKFLAKMAVCESTVLKMLDRYQHTKGLIHYEERINLYHNQLKYWRNYLIKNKIDICFFSVVPHVVYDFIIYSLCKELGIKTFMLYRLPVLPGKNVSIYVMPDIKAHISGLREAYNFYLNKSDDLIISDRMKAYLELRGGNEGKTFTGIERSDPNIKKYIQPSRYIRYIKYKCDYYREWLRLWGNPYDLIDRLAYNMRRLRVPAISFQNQPDLSCPYIFVAFHYQPECTTSPMGGMFVHQDLMLDMLMKYVPRHVRIYVKAHPKSGLSRMLHDRLQTDSRTELIVPSFNSHKLIVNSVAVATITGTAGWEAFINRKPVLMFGDYFYQDAPGVYKVKSVSDISCALSDILEKRIEITDHMVKAFLKAVDDKTFPGWVDNRYAPLSGISNDENAANIAHHLSAAVSS